MQTQNSFTHAIEEILKLSVADRKEIQEILEKNLKEELRLEIYQDYKKAKKEEQKGNLKVAKNIDELKQILK